jgi:hypothetical protein
MKLTTHWNLVIKPKDNFTFTHYVSSNSMYIKFVENNPRILDFGNLQSSVVLPERKPQTITGHDVVWSSLRFGIGSDEKDKDFKLPRWSVIYVLVLDTADVSNAACTFETLVTSPTNTRFNNRIKEYLHKHHAPAENRTVVMQAAASNFTSYCADTEMKTRCQETVK